MGSNIKLEYKNWTVNDQVTLTMQLGSKKRALRFIKYLKSYSNLLNTSGGDVVIVNSNGEVGIINKSIRKENAELVQDLVRISVRVELLPEIIEDIDQALKNAYDNLNCKTRRNSI